MKSFTAILALALLAAIPAMAEETPEQIVTQLQVTYETNMKAMDDGNIDAFMALYAEDYIGRIPPDGTFDRDQIREIASGEMKQNRRARIKYTVENVEFVAVESEGGKRREIVASVLQTIMNEAIDRQGNPVKKSLKVRFKDTVVKNGDQWQIRIREPQ